MPFDGTWFYGDSLFIVDPWLWLLLGTGWLIGRRPSWRLTLLIAVPGGFLLLRTVFRGPEFAMAVGLVVAILLAVLFWKPSHRIVAHRAATVGLLLGASYILAMITLHAATESDARRQLAEHGLAPLDSLMVGPMPANPLAWDVVFVHRGSIRSARFRWIGANRLLLGAFERQHAGTSELWPQIQAGGEPAGFLEWTRFPWVEVASPEEGPYVSTLR